MPPEAPNQPFLPIKTYQRLSTAEDEYYSIQKFLSSKMERFVLTSDTKKRWEMFHWPFYSKYLTVTRLFRNVCFLSKSWDLILFPLLQNLKE